MDFEDEGEQWLNPRYGCRGGNSEDVWHEEVEHPWDCPETRDRYEQLNKTVSPLSAHSFIYFFTGLHLSTRRHISALYLNFHL